MIKTTSAAVVAVALLGLAGCATKGDIESLRSDIAGVRAVAEQANQKATMASEQAQKAAADAAKRPTRRRWPARSRTASSARTCVSDRRLTQPAALAAGPGYGTHRGGTHRGAPVSI